MRKSNATVSMAMPSALSPAHSPPLVRRSPPELKLSKAAARDRSREASSLQTWPVSQRVRASISSASASASVCFFSRVLGGGQAGQQVG